MAIRLAPIPATTSAASRDSRLRSVRRLDWRFLLADPSLDSVAYLGAGADGMLSALRAHSRSLRVLNRGESEVHANAGFERCDLVVVQAPRRNDLLLAASSLRPGGWLYCELPSSEQRSVESEFLSPARARTELETAGIEVVETYWHNPDFESCTRMIPLSQATVLASLVARTSGPAAPTVLPLVSAFDRVLPRVLPRVLGALGVLSDVSLIGHKGGEA